MQERRRYFARGYDDCTRLHWDCSSSYLIDLIPSARLRTIDTVIWRFYIHTNVIKILMHQAKHSGTMGNVRNQCGDGLFTGPYI